MSKEADIFAGLFDYDLFVKSFEHDFTVKFKKRDTRRVLADWIDSGYNGFIEYLWVEDCISNPFSNNVNNRVILNRMGIDESKIILWRSMYNEDGNLLGETLQIPLANMDTDHLTAALAIMERNRHVLNQDGLELLLALARELTKRNVNEKNNTITTTPNPILTREANASSQRHRPFTSTSGIRAHIQ